jgi:hypothetical protein
VPQGFVGMNLDDPFFGADVKQASQFDQLVAAGVESVRVAFNWAAAQPDKNEPPDLSATDAIVGLAAQRGLTVLPTVLYTPVWDAAPHRPGGYLGMPISDAPYATYVGALVKRYGPHGSFWSANPQLKPLPIRMWQIWNEPEFIYYWTKQPFAQSYMNLVRQARAAIRSVDPHGKVVLAGMPGFEWRNLAQIYKVKGARSLFDVVAAHPYTQRPQNVITFLQKVRQVMAANGDSNKPILATETGWQSTKGQEHNVPQCSSCQTTVTGQANDTAALLPLLGANWRALGLVGFYYYTWVGDEYRNAPPFNFSGLFRSTGNGFVAKPAYQAFRQGALALENCRAKGTMATVCRIPG